MTCYSTVYDNLKQAPIVLAAFKIFSTQFAGAKPLVAPDYAFGQSGKARLFHQGNEASNLRM